MSFSSSIRKATVKLLLASERSDTYVFKLVFPVLVLEGDSSTLFVGASSLSLLALRLAFSSFFLDSYMGV